jgi:threonine dehydratase
VFDEIQAARDRLRGVANLTPVQTSRTLDERVGARVFLKCENFQRIGAFKFRGAYNAISQLTAEERERGVVSYSSGNHAQAIALSGSLLGARTTVVMPRNAPVIKRQATEGYGGRVVEYGADESRREEVAKKLREEGGQVLIPPYDHPHIVAGQGTAVMELLDQVEDLDMILVPVGGGGLISGSAVAAKHRRPECQVVGIEPEVADDATRSFHTGELVTIHNPPTIADGTRTPSLGELNFRLVREYVDDMRTVSEEAIKDAVRFLFYRTKLVVEPSGALGVAALLSGAVAPAPRTAVVLSGGNVDAATLCAILTG